MSLKVAADIILLCSVLAAYTSARLAWFFTRPIVEPRLTFALSMQYATSFLLYMMFGIHSIFASVGVNVDTILYPVHAPIAVAQVVAMVHVRRVFLSYSQLGHGPK